MCKGKNGSFDELEESDTDSSVSMDSASDTDEEDDSLEEEKNEEQDDEDEVVKAIMKSKELHRSHPPTIHADDDVQDICFHPERDLIALGSISGDVFLYEYNNNETKLLSTEELHTDSCRDVEFSQDGKSMFTTGADKAVNITDMETLKLKRIFEDAHENKISKLSVINENIFATGDDEGIVKVWDLRQKSDAPIFGLKLMEDYVSAIITNRDMKYLVCSSGDGSIASINIPAKKLHIQSEEYTEDLTSLGLYKNETKLLATSNKGKMYVFNWGEFGLHSDELPNFTKKSINCAIPITDTIVITGGEDGILRAANLYPYKQLGVVGQHEVSVESLDVSNDGTLIASASLSNQVNFWNVKYFEDINVHGSEKGGKQLKKKHNLPSSQVENPSDFFSDL